MSKLALPPRKRGRLSEADQRRYDAQLRQWCKDIVEINSTLDFLRHARLLRPREHQFVAGLGNWHGDLTEKQMSWLAAIHSRLQRQTS